MNSTSVTIYWQDTILFHKKTTDLTIGKDFVLPLNGLDNWELLKDNIIALPPDAVITYDTKSLLDSELDITKLKRVNIQISDFRFLIQCYDDSFVFGKYNLMDTIKSKTYIGLSAMFHVGLMMSFACFMPALGIADAEAAEKDQLYLIQQYLNASAERETAAKEEAMLKDVKDSSQEGGTGTRAIGEEGSMGNPNSRATNRSYTIAGPSNNKDIHIAREAAIREASTFGLIGMLNAGIAGDPNTPTASWGRDDVLGNDPLSARGNMWGDLPGESNGSGGLGLSGIGESGGGRGEGIGVGDIGTIGHGSGLGDNQGFGNGHGRFVSGHKAKVPQARMGTSIISGRLPAEVIQRVVRQNYGRFRSCYEIGLRTNPSLQGRVSVRFVIGRDGSVSNVGNGGSDIPDTNVINCVVRSYYGLSFPAPENGIVTVIYPIMFTAQ